MRKNRISEKAVTKERAKFGVLPKMLLGTLIPLVVVLTLIGIQLSGKMGRTVRDIESDYLTAETGRAVESIRGYFERFMGVAESSAKMQEIVQGASDWGEDFDGSAQQSDLTAVLQKISEEEESVAFAWVADLQTGAVQQSDGTYLDSSSFDIEGRSWYEGAVSQKTTTVTGAYTDAVTGEVVVTVATPIYSGNNQIAVFGLDVLLDTLSTKMSEITVGESGYVTVYDSENNIIYHPNSELLMLNASEVDYSSNIKEAIVNNETVEGLKYTRSGTEYTGSTVYLDDLGYYVLGLIPQEEFEIYIQDTSRTITLRFALTVLLLAVITVIFSLSITKSVKKLSAAAGKKEGMR